MYELHACMNDDVKLYGLKVKSNQFKTLRWRFARQVDDSILDELGDVDEVVAITKAKLQAIAKGVDRVDEIDPVVEIVHEKRRGRLTLAEAASKLDKLQEIEKFKPEVVRRIEIRKNYDFIIILIFYILNLKGPVNWMRKIKKNFVFLLKKNFLLIKKSMQLFFFSLL